jgi:hypothetical protein
MDTQDRAPHSGDLIPSTNQLFRDPPPPPHTRSTSGDSRWLLSGLRPWPPPYSRWLCQRWAPQRNPCHLQPSSLRRQRGSRLLQAARRVVSRTPTSLLWASYRPVLWIGGGATWFLRLACPWKAGDTTTDSVVSLTAARCSICRLHLEGAGC